MQEAIQLAQEGGWGNWYDLDVYEVSDEPSIREDPDFWRCLGKQLGWEQSDKRYVYSGSKRNWITVWHRYINHLAEGKDAESFFISLLKK